MQAGKTKMTKRLGVAVVAAAAALTLTACGSSSDTATSSTTSAAATSAAATSKASSAASGSAAPGSGESSLAPVPEGDTVAVTLITKDSINPFFVAMQEGAKAAAEKDNVDSDRSPPVRPTATKTARSRRSRTPSPAATRAS